MTASGRDQEQGRSRWRGRPRFGLLCLALVSAQCGGQSTQPKSSAAGAAGLAAQSGSAGSAGASGGSGANGGSPQAGSAGAGLKCPTAPEPDPACPGLEPEAGSACSPDELNCSWGGACGTACRCWRGAWNCGMRVCVAGCDYSDPTRCYYGRSPSSCETIDFECQSGMVFFQDECGCGCRLK